MNEDDTESLSEWLAEFEAKHGPIIHCVIGRSYVDEEWAGDEVVTLDDPRLAVRFDSGFGGTECRPCTAWSETHVFILGEYDGSEWWTSVPRNPRNEASGHIGG